MRLREKERTAWRSRKGSALALVVMVLFVISAFSAIVMMLFRSNLDLTMRQNRNTEAYYLAYSGAELAYAALAADNNDLFNRLKAGSISSRSQTINADNGTVYVVATRVETGTTYYGNYPHWIMITATGTVTNGGLSRTRILLIDSDDPRNMVWK
jgi:uncharacterized membrane protein